MTLYATQKFLYELNRSEDLQRRYLADRRAVLEPYDLTAEETEAIVEPDIGKLFHLGVNGQILMHFAAFHQIEWQDYLQRMRDGIAEHGPVREGVYAMTTALDEVVAPVHRDVLIRRGDERAGGAAEPLEQPGARRAVDGSSTSTQGGN